MNAPDDNLRPDGPAAPEPAASGSPAAAPAPRTFGKVVNEQIRFFHTLLLAALAVLCYYAYAAKTYDVVHLYEGEIILALAMLPALLWARGANRQFPTFEAYLFTFGNSFAIPLLTGHEQLKFYSVDTITTSALAVICFQVCAIIAFLATPGHPKRGPLWQDEIFSDQFGRYLGYGMVINSVYVYISTYQGQWIPAGMLGPSRAIFFGVGIVCTFVQTYRWGLGTLQAGEKGYFLVNLAFQMIVLTSTLFLINGISLLVLALAGYVTGSRRIPVITCVVSFLFLGVLHNGKFVMRAKYWDTEGSGARLETVADLPAFYLEWFEAGLQLAEAQNNPQLSRKLLERTSLFHMMCLVVSWAPARQPFLNGETYQDIPAQFVPRYFWPDKPLGHVSTYRLSIYFGLQREEDTAKTTIGFGAVTESYANYGFFGVCLVGALIGFCQRKVRRWTANSPLLSFPGIFTVLLMSWSFNTEQTMSMWLASFYQACASVLGSLVIVRYFFK
jgi:hypothetical protein